MPVKIVYHSIISLLGAQLTLEIVIHPDDPILSCLASTFASTSMSAIKFTSHQSSGLE